ncbi:histidine phosphatase family protein [Clostridium botulinum]|uniref:histidine phosphatase family protein n=1 Tax=Clostridium botulinum TaxID=1491 RepID=UPI001FD64B81|nr:histidine phosphatase family protein [Clostridium botulinum]MCJ8174439.1 phosphoglycerate mutase family protein [Clostridium botulinum]
MAMFYLIRHGEPDWALNEKHKLKGHGRDLPSLTENGIKQAKEIAKDSRLKKAEIIISSPYTRAMQTAAIISKEIGVDLTVEFDLREWQPDLNFEIASLDDLKNAVDEYNLYDGIYPEGKERMWELKETMRNRMENVLEKYSKCSCVIVVAHEQIIKTQVSNVDIPHCSIHEVFR